MLRPPYGESSEIQLRLKTVTALLTCVNPVGRIFESHYLVHLECLSGRKETKGTSILGLIRRTLMTLGWMWCWRNSFVSLVTEVQVLNWIHLQETPEALGA